MLRYVLTEPGRAIEITFQDSVKTKLKTVKHRHSMYF